jgi:hypothetical protein
LLLNVSGARNFARVGQREMIVPKQSGANHEDLWNKIKGEA